jgi:prefoldin subunit 5
MTIDERLERLTARHEALTMNLELLARDVQDLRAAIEKNTEHISGLVRVAELHHERLIRLEGSED